MKNQRYMVLDYETFSEADLKAVGSWEYSVHKTTEILCAAFRIGTRDELANAETHLMLPSGGESFGLFFKTLMNPEIKLVAHNALFEQVITRNVFGKRLMYKSEYLQKIPVSRWICTAAMAASVGVPRHLDGAGSALNLKHQKDKDGQRVMLKLCKPRKPSKNDPSTRWDDVDDYAALYSYCIADIAAEVEIFLTLPELNPREREFWELDQRINLRGFAVDRPLVQGALALIDRETERLDNTMFEVTNGKVKSARQRDALLDYIFKLGYGLPDLQAATVSDALTRTLPPKVRQILEIRDAVSRSSTAKYAAFEARTRSDGRARDNTLFYGAHTGRNSGTGLQPQNLFKRVLPQAEVESALPLIQAANHGVIQKRFDKPMDLYASALRSAIIAAPGYVLDVADFSTIEVRVLFWLAGHKKGLDAIASGKDLYLDMASRIYSIKLSDLVAAYKAEDDSAKEKRQLGKQTVLGAGFGIGVGGEKFQASAKSYGMDISLTLAQNAVKAYRELHAPVVHFWSTIENAAKLAMANPGKAYKHGFLVWKREGDWLTVKLPIGRKLRYYKPEIRRTPSLYGDRVTLTYLGVNSVTKQFERQTTWGGKLTENVVQAVARDILMEALWRINYSTKSRPVLSVHDEVIAERKLCAESDTYHKLFLELMAVVPDWCKGLPIKVEGWQSDRYRK